MGLTSRNDVVDNDNPLSLLYSIGLQLEMIRPILLLIARRNRLTRQLALLPHRHKPSPKPQRQRRPKQEPSTLQPHHNIHLAFLSHIRAKHIRNLQLQRADQAVVQRVRGEQRHDVFEENALGREVWELAQTGSQAYFKTGEFGGTGGSGGGESSFGILAGGEDVGVGVRACLAAWRVELGMRCAGRRVWLLGRRVRGSGSFVGLLRRGRGVIWMAVRRVVVVGDRSATHC